MRENWTLSQPRLRRVSSSRRGFRPTGSLCTKRLLSTKPASVNQLDARARIRQLGRFSKRGRQPFNGSWPYPHSTRSWCLQPLLVFSAARNAHRLRTARFRGGASGPLGNAYYRTITIVLVNQRECAEPTLRQPDKYGSQSTVSHRGLRGPGQPRCCSRRHKAPICSLRWES
jgi:hypothetical protein